MMNTEVQKLYHNCQIGKEDIERTVSKAESMLSMANKLRVD